MPSIDKSKPVLVTGASGYVAAWIVKRLLDEGLTVHAAVRDPKNEDKIAHLNQVAAKSSGSIKFFKADLLEPGSYSAAMEDCQLVYHTASPFFTEFKNAQKQLIEPALNGTTNVLNSVNSNDSVKRVVLTSSCAAIYCDAIDSQRGANGLTEEMWNETANIKYQPYSYSKTLAEKKAWEMMKAQDKWDLVSINPSFVMGPSFNPTTGNSESMSVLTQVGDGTMKSGAPRMGVGLVDVRDVAVAHFRAGFYPNAKGRYICSAYNSDFFEMSSVLLDKYGSDYPLPRKVIPKWLLYIFGPLTSKMFSWRFIKNNVEQEWKADNSKIKKDLEMNFRPLKTTMEDAFQCLIEAKIIAPK